MDTLGKEKSIKAYAKLAKKRLMNGYWNSIRREREEYLNRQCVGEQGREKLRQIYARRIESELPGLWNTDPDAEIYKKVCKLLTQNELVLNPISQLINHDEYDKLDEHAKQHYIINLTDKYNQLKTRFLREQQERSMFGLG